MASAKFTSQIVDDDYTHALRVYRDGISGAVRLQASVYKRPKEHTPIWTAFITSHLNRKFWLRRIDERTVIVRDLQLSIFMMPEDYMPGTTVRGDHILKFKFKSGERILQDTFLDNHKV
ncbi:maltose acetyltransferase family protein [Penicillium malachiteum]|uniref:Maltose acetyltransferase family protein n=1 Tax=Penicillium malachiteum TaxID=1324776 RepID=A0AAD6HV15_9EURO|nr:maltose acetyltransferase family protein [Penicillium malachiteum]